MDYCKDIFLKSLLVNKVGHSFQYNTYIKWIYMEKNKNKQEQEKGVRKENENQRTSPSHNRDTSYQDIPGAKGITGKNSKDSDSSTKDRNTERNR